MISNVYAIELLKKALEIYTPSKQEEELARFIAEKAENELGFERIYIDDVGNVIAKKGEGEPKIMLCGHMDTVPGKIPVRIEDGLLYGRGASDAKAPLISMLLAASMVQREYGTIIFAGLVDEEGNATGVKNLVKNKIDVDYAIFGEPSGLENITIGYKGRLALKIICDVGDSAHASAPMLAKNAIEEMYGIWYGIKDLIEDENSKYDKPYLTACLTEIEGGTSHNVTPAKCSITVDIRIPTRYNTHQILDMVHNTITSIAKKRDIDIKYSIEDSTEPFEAAYNSPLVRALVLGIMDITNKRPKLVRKTGTGDMNVLGSELKIPVVTYGPGDAHSSHSIDEHVSIDEYIASIEVFKRCIYHLSRLHKRKKS
ncbi:MAG: M20/M25/M40 family metallo-hydrolase [Candidatus Nitrosothermus koennekii]|nr:MAG: M20/M25/M40 family metallo-hydrolase [Candidatus Nitrosothermus koennekii]